MKDISRGQTGHIYDLANFGYPDEEGQKLVFINKEKDEAGNLVLVHDGTTNEEVISMLIDRIQKLNTKFPCNENEVALCALKLALVVLNKRTADRKARGVEGKATL